jgi:hypothetical protein
LLRWEKSPATGGPPTKSPSAFQFCPRGTLARTLASLVVAAVLLGACGGDTAQETRNQSAGFKELTSADGALQLRVPDSWEVSELNPVAAVQAGDPEAEAYGVVIEDPRKPLKDYTLERFAEAQMQQLVTGIGLASLSAPERVQVDGKDAVQYQLKGFFDQIEVVYLYTFVETPDRFLKVVTWSLASEFEDNKDVLEQVATSVRELKGLPSPTPEPSNTTDPAVVPTQNNPGVFDRDPNA